MKNRSFKHIAKLIKNKRLAHAKRYSQSELSTMLGYKNGQFISNVERGLCNIPLKMIPLVCEILTINPTDIKAAMLADFEETLNNFVGKGQSGGSEANRSKVGEGKETSAHPNLAVTKQFL